jgi:hypothetical protein
MNSFGTIFVKKSYIFQQKANFEQGFFFVIGLSVTCQDYFAEFLFFEIYLIRDFKF